MKKNKIISVILTVALLTSGIAMYNTSVSAAETNTKKVLGDVNNDNVINVNDVTGIQKYIADITDLTDNQKFVADTNGDNQLTILDATELQKYVADYTAVNNNIGKTWHDDEYETITIPGETINTPKLRYDYVTCNVCNICLKPMMYKNGKTFNSEEIGVHMQREHGGGRWHSADHWFYVDDNGIYHDLSDDWKLPNVNFSNPDSPYYETDYWDEGSMNVFDVGFNPYNGTLTQEIYNSEHEDKLDYYWTTEIRSICRDCNDDGSSIYVNLGGTLCPANKHIGADGRPMFLTLTEPVEVTYYPDRVADMTALDKAYNTAEQTVAKHKAWHKKQNNLPDYRNNNAEAVIIEHDRIYTTVKTTTEPTTETVFRKAGWY